MKKRSVLVCLFIVFFALNSFAQRNPEYRYVSFLLGMNHGYGMVPDENIEIMLKTVQGDMLKKPGAAFNYSPGFQTGLLYHMDSKNNKFGVVLGLEYFSQGFKNHYLSESGKFTLTESFRTSSVGIPIIFKFGFTDIYQNMKYFTFGVQYNYNFSTSLTQRVNWNNEPYKHKMLPAEKNTNYIFLFVGYNIKMLNFQLNYSINNFVNTNYQFQKETKIFSPYAHIPKGNICFQTSINLPLTRWLTINNWQAEKIRRKLSGNAP